MIIKQSFDLRNEKIKCIVVGGLDKNKNDKIDYIAVMKAEKENDCESMLIFLIESIMELNNVL